MKIKHSIHVHPLKVCDSGNEADEEGLSEPEASSSVSSFSLSVDDIDENGATEEDEYSEIDASSMDEITSARKKIKPTADRRNLRKTSEGVTKRSRKIIALNRPPLDATPKNTNHHRRSAQDNRVSYQVPRRQIYRAIFRHTIPLPEPPAESGLGSGFESNDEMTELEASFDTQPPHPAISVSSHHSQPRNHFHPLSCHQQHTRSKAKTLGTSSNDERGGEGDVEDLDEEDLASREVRVDLPPPSSGRFANIAFAASKKHGGVKTDSPAYTYAKSTVADNEGHRNNLAENAADVPLLPVPPPKAMLSIISPCKNAIRQTFDRSTLTGNENNSVLTLYRLIVSCIET